MGMTIDFQPLVDLYCKQWCFIVVFCTFKCTPIPAYECIRRTVFSVRACTYIVIGCAGKIYPLVWIFQSTRQEESLLSLSGHQHPPTPLRLSGGKRSNCGFVEGQRAGFLNFGHSLSYQHDFATQIESPFTKFCIQTCCYWSLCGIHCVKVCPH